jgi:DNA repair exonuclease SbcCD ATPase subunit
MNAQPREGLESALAADDPLAALRCAFAWAARAAAAAQADPDETAAVAAVLALDDALTDAGRLTAGIPALLDKAQLGPAVQRYLAERQRELSELAERVAAARAAHDELARTGAERQARLAEHEQLQDRIREVRRLERLLRALDELESQRGLIEARVEALTEATGDTEQALEAGGGQLVAFTEAALDALTPRTRELAERLIAVQNELSTEEETRRRDEAALAEAAERTEQLRAMHEQRVAGLSAHASADRELAAALSALGGLPPGPERTSLERAQILLDEVESRLTDLDAALGGSLARLDEAGRREHAVVGWSDAGA